MIRSYDTSLVRRVDGAVNLAPRHRTISSSFREPFCAPVTVEVTELTNFDESRFLYPSNFAGDPMGVWRLECPSKA